MRWECQERWGEQEAGTLRRCVVSRVMNMEDRREGQGTKGGEKEGKLCHPVGGWQSLAISVFLS